MKIPTYRYIIEDRTRGTWPGLMPYRGHGSRGYRTADEAQARAVRVMTAYAARVGRLGGPDLRVVAVQAHA